MNSKAITLAKRITKKSAAAVLDSAYVHGNGSLTYTNLYTTVTHKEFFPVDNVIEGLISINFLDKASKVFKKDYQFGFTGGKYSFTSSKKTASVDAEGVDEFPVIHEVGKVLYTTQISKLKKAVTLAGKDDLRPVMTGVFIGRDGMAATDAHKMYYDFDSGCPELETVIPTEAVNALLDDGEVNIGFCNNDDRTGFLESDSQIVYFRVMDEKFPNFKAVIPEDSGNSFTVNVKEFKAIIKELLPFANRNTNRIDFLPGKGVILAQDLDFGTKLETGFNLVNIPHNFGVNAKFLMECLNTVDEEEITVDTSAPNRAIKIGANVICMPVMLD